MSINNNSQSNVSPNSGSRNAGTGENSNESVVLNERQKLILSELGLPTDYEELEWKQQNSIIAIDELLTYLENKYEIPFSYAGYHVKSALENERLIAYPSDGDKKLDVVTVTRKDGEITDNYIDVALRPILNQVFSDYVGRNFAENDFKVFTPKPTSEIDSLPIDVYDLGGKFYGGSKIFIGLGNTAETEFDEFVKGFAGWLSENRYYGASDIVLTDSESIKYLTEDNCSDYFDNDMSFKRITCILHRGGNIEIIEW